MQLLDRYRDVNTVMRKFQSNFTNGEQGQLNHTEACHPRRMCERNTSKHLAREGLPEVSQLLGTERQTMLPTKGGQ